MKRNLEHHDSTQRAPLYGVWVMVIFIAVCIIFALTSCTKKVYVPVETIKENVVYRTDTLKQVTTRYDSIYVRDSVSLMQRNDTVFLTKYKDQVKYLYRTDTVYSAKNDSVNVYIEKPTPYEVEVVKHIENPLKWWQKTLMWLGVAFFALLAFVVYKVIRKRIP